MIYKYNKKLVRNAQGLRKNMTKQEKHLWYDFLKMLPMTVNRQRNIGNYIVDFFIPSASTVIEIDGIQHTMTENEEADGKRDEYLTKLGINVLRYTNPDIDNNFSVVCNDILAHLGLSANDLKK